MKSWPQPTAEEVERALRLAARPEQRAYLFDRLDNPLWVAELDRLKVFSDPPPVQEVDGSQFSPQWPEGRYLARMATEVPDDVLDILERVPVSENPAVVRHVLEVVGRVAPAQPKRAAKLARKWGGGPHPMLLSEATSIAAVELVRAGRFDDGLALVEPLLVLSMEAPQGGRQSRATREQGLHSVVGEWEYARVVERLLPALTAAAKVHAVEYFADLLARADRLIAGDDAPSTRFHYLWRPSIAEHPQNMDRGYMPLLIRAVRISADQVLAEDPESIVPVVNGLERDGDPLLRRIALYLLATHGGPHDVLAERIAAHELYEDLGFRHEYAELLRQRLGEVDEGTREGIFDWIRGGPQLEGRDLSNPEAFAEIWKRDAWSFVAPYLGHNDREAYVDLVNRYGEAEHPGFAVWTTGWTGPTSPEAAAELAKRSPEELVEYLSEWRPEHDAPGSWGPSMEGLGREIEAIVEESPSRYASEALRFVDLHPTYVRSLLSGVSKALRKEEGDPFEWDPLLRLALDVARRPPEREQDLDRDRDPGFSWTRHQIADLISDGFRQSPFQIPWELRELSWAVLEPLTRDPNPDAAYEAEYGGDNMDPFTLSLNTTRPAALHAAIAYGLWVRACLGGDDAGYAISFDDMPELRAVLDAHLDLAVDDSLAVRAVYGRWLPWLALLDEGWTVESVPRLFPEESPAHANATWAAYVTWAPAYRQPFELLKDQYELAVLAVPSDLRGSRFGDESADEKLGQHLVLLTWLGVEDAERQLYELFDRAGDDLAAALIRFVGRAAEQAKGDLPQDVAARLVDLWERRAGVAREDPKSHQAELRAFGLWVYSGKFDPSWALERLVEAVNLSGTPELADLVLEGVARSAGDFPSLSISILRMMLNAPSTGWDYLGWRGEAKEIAGSALRADDEETRASAREVIDMFVRKGELDFRALV